VCNTSTSKESVCEVQGEPGNHENYEKNEAEKTFLRGI
jgi:hypothetical protein